jgi:peptide/nickel transport system substrate-binding protein
VTGNLLQRFIVVFLCATLLACDTRTFSTEEKQALRFAVASAPLNLDSRMATDATAERLNHLLYRSLVEFDEARRPVPGLASWQRLAPRQYRFMLGETGRKLTDGRRLQAQHVKDTYSFILEPANASPHRGNLSHIVRIDVLDEDRLDFYLSRPDSLFPARLGTGIAVEDKQGGLVGSGPFRLHDAGQLHDVWLQRRRDGQLFRFLHVADPTVRVLKLLRGEVDMLQNDLPPELIRHIADKDTLHLQTRPGTNFTYLGFNLGDAVTGQAKLRQAIAMAINRKAIIQHLFAERARPAASILPPEHWAGFEQASGVDFDPAGARRLLAELGYSTATPVNITYKTSTDPVRLRIATVIRQQLAEVGIDVEIRSYDWGTFFADIKAGNFQMYSLSWVGVRSPDIFEYVFHSRSVPPAGANRGRYKSLRADSLIDAAIGAANDIEMTGLWQELQAHLLDDLPYVPLWYEHQVYVSRGGVTAYQLSADGNYDGLNTVDRVKR